MNSLKCQYEAPSNIDIANVTSVWDGQTKWKAIKLHNEIMNDDHEGGVEVGDEGCGEGGDEGSWWS